MSSSQSRGRRSVCWQASLQQLPLRAILPPTPRELPAQERKFFLPGRASAERGSPRVKKRRKPPIQSRWWGPPPLVKSGDANLGVGFTLAHVGGGRVGLPDLATGPVWEVSNAAPDSGDRRVPLSKHHRSFQKRPWVRCSGRGGRDQGGHEHTSTAEEISSPIHVGGTQSDEKRC